jgi:hypothetical protein
MALEQGFLKGIFQIRHVVGEIRPPDKERSGDYPHPSGWQPVKSSGCAVVDEITSWLS